MAKPTEWRVTCHDCRHQEDTEGRVKPSQCPSCHSENINARRKQPTWDVLAVVTLPDGSQRQLVFTVESTQLHLASQRAAGRVQAILAANKVPGRSNVMALSLKTTKRTR